MRGKRAENATCRIEGCAKPTRSLGVCGMHYARWSRHGDVGGAQPQIAVSWAGIECSVEDCTSQVKSLGYCTAHLKRFKRYGDATIKRPTRPAEERFWSRVDKSGDCWLWTAGRQSMGYGTFYPAKGVNVLAHRYAYQLARGAIPSGLVLDHLCRVRLCVNPDHLEPVTNEENLARGLGYALRNGMRSTCINGHDYDEANTYRDPRGGVRCRACARENNRNRSAAARRAKNESEAA